MTFQKSQTATEYLVILAVVIVISLIVVGVLGGIPSIGGGASANAVKAQLSNYGPLKIDNWAVFRNETKVIVQNINPDSIRLNSFTLNGTETVLNKQLRAGQRYEFSVDVSMLNPDKYSFPISFNWTDTSTDAVYVENKEFAILTGTSVNSPFFVNTVVTKFEGGSTGATFTGTNMNPLWILADTGTQQIATFSPGTTINYTATYSSSRDCNSFTTRIEGTCEIAEHSCIGISSSPTTFGCVNAQSDITIYLRLDDNS